MVKTVHHFWNPAGMLLPLLPRLFAAAGADAHEGHAHHLHPRHLRERRHRGESDGRGAFPPGHGIEIHGHYYATKEEFVQSGSACRFAPPGEEERAEIEAKLEAWKKGRRPDQASGLAHHSRDLQQDTIDINVYVHVIYRQDGVGNIPQANIEKQIEVINKAFSGEEGLYPDQACGGDQTNVSPSPFRFTLFETTRTQNDNWFNNMDSSDVESAAKSSLRRGTCRDLNIYTADSDYLGWAYFPTICSSPDSQPTYDGVVLHYGSLPDMGIFNWYDEGDTGTHEVGHWLGLDHTFNGGCNQQGDRVSDTPAERNANYDCVLNKDSCWRDPGFDPVNNFMDYTDDCCMFQFTPGQIARMEDMAGAYRGLALPDPGPTVTPAPTPSVTPAPASCDPFGTPCNGQCPGCCDGYTGSGNNKSCA